MELSITTPNHFISALLLFSLLLTLSLDFTAGAVGVAYGRNGNNLLPPRQVVELYKRHNIKRMRTYDPDSAILDALRGSGIELSVVITNDHLESLTAASAAAAWVRDHVSNFPDVDFRSISVGNEVSPADATARFVLPAIRNVYRALRRSGHAGRVKVTTTVGISALGNFYPPEAGAFRDDVGQYLSPILAFLAATDAPLVANIFPYLAYIDNKKDINIGYALLEQNSGTWINGVYYDNLFYAMLDAVHAAVDRLGGGASVHALNSTEELMRPRKQRPRVVSGESGVKGCGAPAPAEVMRPRKRLPPLYPPMWGGWSLPPRRVNSTAEVMRAGKRGHGRTKVTVGETGHPSRGGDSATMKNAQTYNQNLINVLKNGTPRHPEPIEAYLFALFDENEKPGAETERNFGLFYPNGDPKYDLHFN